MRIGIVNGSPKPAESCSQVLIDLLLQKLQGQEVTVLSAKKATLTLEEADGLCQSDALVFVFPLYADTLPSHMIRLLIALEEHGFPKRDTAVYCLVNNGFFEGDQNAVAIGQMRAFTHRVGLTWGQAVGVGAGELHRSLKALSPDRGPNKNMGKALNELTKHILQRESAEDRFTVPNCPRAVWNFLAKTFKWNAQAKKNGLKKKDIYRRVDAT